MTIGSWVTFLSVIIYMEPGLQNTEDNVRIPVPAKLQKGFGLPDPEIVRHLSKLCLEHQGGEEASTYICVELVRHIFRYLYFLTYLLPKGEIMLLLYYLV